MLIKMLSGLRSLALRSSGKKFLPLFVPLMLVGQTAYLQTTYTGTDVPAVLNADGYARHTAKLGTTTATAMTVTYDNGGSIKAPAVPTTSNIKMLLSASKINFSNATFVQADAVDTVSKTVTFHPPSGFYYTLAISNAADLSIVSIGPASATPGATVSYKLEVKNAGPSAVANAVVTMPNLSNFTVTSVTAVGYNNTPDVTTVPASFSATTAQLKTTGLTIPVIAAFGGVTIMVTGTVGTIAYSNTNAAATITMPAGMTDVQPANNTSVFTTNIFAPGTLSSYLFSKSATLAVAATNYGTSILPTDAVDRNTGVKSDVVASADGSVSFDLIYLRKPGDVAVAPFGDTLKIRATISPMANKANGATNKWRRLTLLNANYRFYLNPYVGTGPEQPLTNIDLFENLPYTNQQTTNDDGTGAMTLQIQAGVFMPLGTYSVAFGAIPAATNPNVAVVKENIVLRASSKTEALSGDMHDMFGTLANINVTDTVRHNTAYTCFYSAAHDGYFDPYNDPGLYSLYGSSYGMAGIDTAMVTFTTLAQPLPLHLLSFTGQHKNDENVLSWSTSMEENTRSFGVERSADGNSFTTIGSEAAAGNSTNTRQYTYNDATTGSDAFYRLRMNNVDGSFTYSAVIRLSGNTQTYGDMTIGNVYPVPFNDVLNVEISSSENQQATVQLYNMNGSLAAQYSQPLAKGANTYQLGGGQFASLAPGIYILSVKTDSGVVTKEVTKQ